jgi:hypothetical protein
MDFILTDEELKKIVTSAVKIAIEEYEEPVLELSCSINVWIESIYDQVKPK